MVVYFFSLRAVLFVKEEGKKKDVFVENEGEKKI